MNIYLAVCSNQNCSNFDVQYRLLDQPGLVECGGCSELLESVLTDEQAPEAPVLATPEEIVAEQEQKTANKESAISKLTALGLTQEEIQAIIGS